MSNNVPAPVNQADSALAEHAAEIRAFGWGHNRLAHLARKIQAGHDRCVKGSQDWVEGSLEVAAALLEGSNSAPTDIGFSGWLKANSLDFYSKDDRAALINLASNLDLFRQVLGETDSRSYRLIWKEFRGRFRSAAKPTKARGRRHKPRMMGLADIHRRTKLGDETVDKLKGTSLESAAEIDELITLNRGAPVGEHTPEVTQLIADAVAGKLVSAIAIGRGSAPKLKVVFQRHLVASWKLATKQERDAFIEWLISISNEK